MGDLEKGVLGSKSVVGRVSHSQNPTCSSSDDNHKQSPRERL